MEIRRTKEDDMKSKKLLLLLAVAALVLVIAAGGAWAAPQASITLRNSDAALCHTNNTEWTLSKTADKTPVESGQMASWTVEVDKGATSDNFLTVNGVLSVSNTGTANATIGNIVVNLQRKIGSKWVTKSSDIADATNGDTATTAKIVAGASSEGKSSFTENAASGSLEFTDKDNNTIWAISPQQTIAPSDTVNLLFVAKFNNTVLNIPAGELVRAEVIVSFGNAGARGGSGASAKSIDINGNGRIDTDEANVRSVPTRLTKTVPNLKECNKYVTLTDPEEDITTTGDVTYNNFNNDGIGDGVTFDASDQNQVYPAQYTVAVDVEAGADGGSVCNAAYLKGEEDCSDCSVSVNDFTKPIYDELGQIIGYEQITFACCIGVDLTDSACVDVNAEQGFQVGDYYTYGKGAYAGTGAPGQLFNTNFPTVFSSGLTIGINDDAGPQHNATWTADAPGPANLKTCLSAGGTPGALTLDQINPTSTTGGTMTRQVAALALNVGFNDANVLGGNSNGTKPFGDLKLCNLVSGSQIGTWTLSATEAANLNGKKVRDVLSDANNTIADGPTITFPNYIEGANNPAKFSKLNTLVETLNGSFDSGTPSVFATAFLCK
jgi:hypothetical protein